MKKYANSGTRNGNIAAYASKIIAMAKVRKTVLTLAIWLATTAGALAQSNTGAITINSQAEWNSLLATMTNWTGSALILNCNVTGPLYIPDHVKMLSIEGKGNTIAGRINIYNTINLTLKNVTIKPAGSSTVNDLSINNAINISGGTLTTEGKVTVTGADNISNDTEPGYAIHSSNTLIINADENATFTGGGKTSDNARCGVFVFGNLILNGSARFIGGKGAFGYGANTTGNMTVQNGSPSFTSSHAHGAQVIGDLTISSSGSPTFAGGNEIEQYNFNVHGAYVGGNLHISAGTPSFKGGSNTGAVLGEGAGVNVDGTTTISGNASPTFTGGNSARTGMGGVGAFSAKNLTVSTSGTVTFIAGTNGCCGLRMEGKIIDFSKLTGKLTATGRGTAIVEYNSIIYPPGLAKSLEYNGTAASYTLNMGATDVEVPSAPTLKVYPNPFTGYVHISGMAVEAGHTASLQIINTTGIIVHTQKIMYPNEALRLEHLPKGMYFFRIEKDGKVETVKAIKN